MANTPTWIIVLQALLTPTIAAVAGLVAFLQWRTAHQKVILDLFERRLQVYEEVNDAVIYALSEQEDLITFRATQRISKAWGDSRFLFGKEVSDAISEVRDDVSKYSFALRRTEHRNLTDEQRTAAAELVEQLDIKIMNFREPFTALCLPYIHMNQKRVRTPLEWLRDKNLQRLSYADEKQQ